jgi:hypothetical protein
LRSGEYIVVEDAAIAVGQDAWPDGAAARAIARFSTSAVTTSMRRIAIFTGATSRQSQRLLAKKVTKASDISSKFCVLVTASDHTKDIFDITFQNSETIWRECDWPRYVGFTSKHPDAFGFKSLAAKTGADWRSRLVDYLDGLPDPIQYVMPVIEDYLFTSPVSGPELNALADVIVRNDLAYVRLIPVGRNLYGRGIERLRRVFDKRPVRLLARSEPYYSSLNVAIWKRDYLRSLLRQPGTVWQLEHVVSTERHYAVWHPVVRYRPLVGKGKWYRQTPRLLAEQGLSLGNSKRAFQDLRFELQSIREKIVFEVVGYLSFRLRRHFNRLPY